MWSKPMTPDSSKVRAHPGQFIQGRTVDAVLHCELLYPRVDAHLRYDLLVHRPGIMTGWSRIECSDDMNQLWPALNEKEQKWTGLVWAVVQARLGLVEKTNWKE